jgi:bacillithiol biosynthesis cysteine-adding enzyme BshC
MSSQPSSGAGHRLPLVGSAFARSLSAAIAWGDATDLIAPLQLQHPDDEVPPACSGADRARLASAIGQQNEAWGHERASKLCQQLADPETRVVVTGQQAGFLGGPLYSLSKAIAAHLWAEKMRQRGVPAVAVYWIATEDHDWGEVATARCLKGRDTVELSLGEDLAPLRPVGGRRLGDASELAAVLDAFAALSPGDRHQHATALVRSCCLAERTLGESFARLMIEILGTACPLLLDSQLPELKRQQSPWLVRLIERRAEVTEALAAAERRLEQRGFSPQVKPSEAAPLFLIDGEHQRRRIEWQGDDSYRLRGPAAGDDAAGDPDAEGRIEDLLAMARDEPQRLSPSALSRPALQDAVLGSALQVMGPGELAYLAQAAALYEPLEVAAPRTSLRPQVALIDSKQELQVTEFASQGIDLATLLGDEQALVAALAKQKGAPSVADARRKIFEVLDALEAPVLALDKTLERPWSKTRDSIARALEQFEGKVVTAAATSDEVRHRRALSLRDHLLPGGKLQERCLCCMSMYGRYGEDLVPSLLRNLDLAPDVLQVITVDRVVQPSTS